MEKKIQVKKRARLANQAGLQSPTGMLSEAATPVESALKRALELSEKDGSIVLCAGSMFVTAEVMKAWNNLAKV